MRASRADAPAAGTRTGVKSAASPPPTATAETSWARPPARREAAFAWK